MFSVFVHHGCIKGKYVSGSAQLCQVNVAVFATRDKASCSRIRKCDQSTAVQELEVNLLFMCRFLHLNKPSFYTIVCLFLKSSGLAAIIS